MEVKMKYIKLINKYSLHKKRVIYPHIIFFEVLFFVVNTSVAVPSLGNCYMSIACSSVLTMQWKPSNII